MTKSINCVILDCNNCPGYKCDCVCHDLDNNDDNVLVNTFEQC